MKSDHTSRPPGVFRGVSRKGKREKGDRKQKGERINAHLWPQAVQPKCVHTCRTHVCARHTLACTCSCTHTHTHVTSMHTHTAHMHKHRHRRIFTDSHIVHLQVYVYTHNRYKQIRMQIAVTCEHSFPARSTL